MILRRRDQIPIAFVVLLLAGGAAAAPLAPFTFELTLEQAESKAVAASPLMVAAEQEAEAANFEARARAALQFPTLSFDASVRHQSVVPQIQVGPVSMPLGDNKNYSYGPTANWLLFDTGGNYRRWRAAQAVARSKRAEADAVRRSVVLSVRLAYLSVQRAVEEQRLLTDGVRVSATQYQDILARERAGAGSRLDSLSSHQELISRERQLLAAQADLAAALRPLFRLTRTGSGLNADVPSGVSAAEAWPPGWKPPTLIVKLEAVAATRARLDLPPSAQFDADNPTIAAFTERARAAAESMAAAEAGHGPTIALQGRVSKDYPNGPIHESITQKSFGATASLPIFEFGRVSDDVAAERRLVAAAESHRDDELENLQQAWLVDWDQLRGLQAQETLLRQAAEETAELARITFDAYKNGGVSHVEVENANFRALGTQVELAQTDTGIATLLAALDSMALPDAELAFADPLPRFDQETFR